MTQIDNFNDFTDGNLDSKDNKENKDNKDNSKNKLNIETYLKANTESIIFGNVCKYKMINIYTILIVNIQIYTNIYKYLL